MKVEVKDVSPVEKMLEVEIPAERVGDEIEEQYAELMRTAHVKGFRPGKAPRKIVERLFKDYIHQQVVKKLVEETMPTAMDRKQLKPVVEPVVDPAELKPGEAYAYTAHLEVAPAVELKEYKGLTVEHSDELVTDAQVDEAIQGVLENAATIRDPEPARPSRSDDQILAEAVIREGETEAYRQADEIIELWRPSWIPGLADRLVGKNIGDRVEFSAEIADDQNSPEKYRGKTLAFDFSIKGIKERILPELNDEFVKDYTRSETVEEFKKAIRERLENMTSDKNRNRREQAVVKALVDKNPVDVPPTLVKREALELAKGFMRQNFRKSPTDQEAERFRDIFLDEAKFVFQANYLLDEVAKVESIEASDEDVEEQIKKDAERMNMHPDKLRARLDDAARAALKRRAQMDKTLDFLLSVATIKEQAQPAE